MRRLLFKFWPFGTIILTVLVFFYPVWLQGEIPLPADFVVGTYYPWLDYKWGYPAGVPVKNPITTDVVSFIYPMRTYAIEILKSGNIPLWNPLILSGTPLLANFQSAPFSPTNIFYFFMDNLSAWSLQVATQPLFASIFLYMLLRELGRSKLASVSGGLFFAFAGFSIIWMEWNAHSLVAAFFPLIFLLTIKWLRDGKWIWGSLLSISFALQIFAGYPQIILYELLALIFLIRFFSFDYFDTSTTLSAQYRSAQDQNDSRGISFKKIPGLLFFMGLGIGLAAIQLLPALELIKLSQRGVEDVINVSAFLPWQMIITFVAPDFFGNHSTGNWWGPGDYTLVTTYSGVAVILLAGIGIITGNREKYVKFGCVLILLSLAVAFENPISSWARGSGFLGLQAASAHRALILANLGFAILAAFGIDRLLNGEVKYYQIIRAYYVPWILIAGFGVASFYGLKVSDGNELLTENFQVALRNLILPTALLGISLIILTTIILFKKYRQILTVILIVFAVSELFRFGWKFTPFSGKEIVFPNTPVLEFLQKQKKPFRVTAEDVIPINMMMNFGIETTEGYDAVYPLQYANYLASLNSDKSMVTPQGRYGSVTNYNSSLINVANTKYVLVLLRAENGSPDENGKLPAKFIEEYLKPVFKDKSVLVLENTNNLDRAKMFYEWEVNGDDIKTLNTIVDPAFSYKDTLILSKEPEVVSETGKWNVNYNEIPNQKKLDIITDKAGILFIGDSLYPGWEAFLDGKRVEIIKADYNFMAVPIKDAGKHEIIIKYEPESFGLGKGLSTGSLSVLILLIFSFTIKKWKILNR